MRRRLSVEERRQRGLGSQSRAGALSQIPDPRLRRAIDALTSTENFNLEDLTFDSDGRLTIREDRIREIVGTTEGMTASTRLPNAAAKDDKAVTVEGHEIKFTQLPPRAPVSAGTTLENLVARVNEILVDQRNAGHRARGDSVFSEDGADPADFTPLSYVTISANYTALLTDDVIIYVALDTSTVTITLPPLSTALGKLYRVKMVSSPTGVMNVTGDGSETIDGLTNWAYGNQYTSITYVGGSSEWHIV